MLGRVESQNTFVLLEESLNSWGENLTNRGKRSSSLFVCMREGKGKSECENFGLLS